MPKSIFIRTSELPETKGKHYASYCEFDGGENYHRYLRPNGWQLQCYYWSNKAELEQAVEKFRDESLAVSQWERQSRQQILHDLSHDFGPRGISSLDDIRDLRDW